ncbi:MAG TPA: sulfatase [Candidatus Polarisedimenticolaceae bacterium]|nr:sulfatase [Candidatus Polarisedimenticolaceae bacterium]
MLRLGSPLRARSAVVAPAIGLSLVAASCGEGHAPAPACPDLSWTGPRPGTSLVLVVNDTLRRDRVGIYGGPDQTPTFDAFARGGMLFERATSQAPWTSPAIASLFSGLYPSAHGVRSHPYLRATADGATTASATRKVDVLGDDLTLLAELLDDAGYHTAAIVGNPWLERRFGFAQGFDFYDDSFADWDAPGRDVAGAALDWLAGVPDGEPYFLYVHTMDTHRPYPSVSREALHARRDELVDDRRPLDPAVRQSIADLVFLEGAGKAVRAGLTPSLSLIELAYDAGVRAFDDSLSVLLEGMAGEAEDETALIVLSDHGEALFSRGWGNHGHGLYEDEVAIPMAARLPGVRAERDRVGCPTGLVDVLPTVCSYLDLDCPDDLGGESFLAPRKQVGSLADRRLLVEGVMHKPQNRAVRDRRYKLLLQPQPDLSGTTDALFDTSIDPGETTNLLEPGSLTPRHAEVRAELERAAREMLSRSAPASNDDETVPLDAATERRLRSLGYIR